MSSCHPSAVSVITSGTSDDSSGARLGGEGIRILLPEVQDVQLHGWGDAAKGRIFR
ncbi:MAG: hypothetical protein JXA20_09630 [Spirochaetes bacterium]|nr:hypothetical protein [Spirochaetota bacterium]